MYFIFPVFTNALKDPFIKIYENQNVQKASSFISCG